MENTKSAFAAIVGRPNVGKSSILNALLGQKIAIVSSKPQTTRTRIMGVLTHGETQIVFTDTPGMHLPKNKLGDYMMKAANDTLSDVDVVLYVVEADKHISPSEEQLMDKLSRGSIPSILLINKIDTSTGEKVGETIKTFTEKHDFNAVIPISAMKNKGIDIIFEEIDPFMQESEWFFPDDIATDQPERQIAAEIIREKILRLTNDEIPHGTAVVIEDFTENANLVSIRAEIFCERESHKGILIGKNGATLKKIGTYAREDLEKLLGVQVYLNLWVKVKENWRDSAAQVANFGFREE